LHQSSEKESENALIQIIKKEIPMDAKKLLVTAAFAGLTLASCATAASSQSSDVKTGKCYGVNACKGHGDCSSKGSGCDSKNGCDSKGNECKAHNACKGMGWNKMDKVSCEKKGGKFEA